MQKTTTLTIVIIISLAYTLIPFPLYGNDRGIGIVIKDRVGKEVGLYKESHALIIGISDYTAGWPDLPGVKKDIKVIKNLLVQHGFKVLMYNNLKDRSELDKVFTNFISKNGRNLENRLLFYFAGHGHTEELSDGRTYGYIVPANAPDPHNDKISKSRFKDMAMSMQQIEVYAKKIESKHALFVFDSCFSGSIFALSRAVPGHISEKTNLPVRQFITSGSEDELVSDKSEFRNQFVAALKGEGDSDKDGYVTVTELGEFLYRNVIKYSEETQHPQYGKLRDRFLDKGDFVFQLPVTLRKNEFSLEGLEEEAVVIEENRQKRWNNYQVDMNSSYDKVLNFQQRDITSELKIKAWKEFLKSFKEDNPHSDSDEKMRKEANNRIVYEKQVIENKRVEEQAVAKRKAEKERQKMVEEEQTRKKEEGRKRELIDPVTGMEFVYVQGGCYQMGDTFGEGKDDEKPVHEVCVDDYYIGKYEVTQGEWKEIMGSNPSYFKNGDNYPVEHVSWDDTQEFIKELNKKTDKKYRLPTEAEWEYVARSGGKKEKWSGTNSKSELSMYAWCRTNSGFKTNPVGRKKPNGLGIYDMSGNVWEWVEDVYNKEAYKKHLSNNPLYVKSGSYRVVRGGSWYNEPVSLRASYRGIYSPDYRSDNPGFRVARNP